MAIVLIVCFLSFVLLEFVVHIIRENEEDVGKMQEFRDKHAFVTSDDTPDIEVQRILSQSNSKELLSMFFRSLYEDGISFCTDYGYSMYYDKAGFEVRYHTVNELFFQFYGLSAEKGRLFTEEEYASESEVVPVVIGYNLRNTFALGEQYFFENPTGGGGFQGQIVGVLKKNSEYYRINNVAINLSLDSSYIVPFGVWMCTPDRAVSDYDMALSGLVLFLDDPGVAEVIEKRIREMNLFRYQLVDVDNAADEAITEQKKSIIAVTIVLCTILIAVFITSLLVFRKVIRAHAEEIGIRVLCGASVKHITGEVAALTAVLIAIAVIPAVFLAEIWQDRVLCLGFGLILFVMVTLIPRHLVRKLSVIEIVRNPGADNC